MEEGDGVGSASGVGAKRRAAMRDTGHGAKRKADPSPKRRTGLTGKGKHRRHAAT